MGDCLVLIEHVFHQLQPLGGANVVSFIARRQISLPCSAMVLIVNSSCRTAKGSLGNFCGSSSASAITRCSRRRTFLLFGCALLLDGVTALLAAWTLIRVPIPDVGRRGPARQPSWPDGPLWRARYCCSESRRCWAVSRSRTALDCRGGWWRG